MVHCIIAYVSPKWSRKLNFFKRNMTEFEYLRTMVTKQHYFTNSGHIQQWDGCYCSVQTSSFPTSFYKA
jgi:hypothetical protein